MEMKIIIPTLVTLCVLLQLSTAQNFRGFNSRFPRLRFRPRPPSRFETFSERRERFCRRNPTSFRCRRFRPTPRPAPRTTARPQPQPPRAPSNLSDMRRRARDFVNRNRDRIPKMVQMTFHTCVGNTGCDGCMNFREPSNRGIERHYTDVRNEWRRGFQDISLADFVVLLGISAAEIGMGRPAGTMRFRTGRRTCSNPDNYQLTHTFPKGQDPGSIDFLTREFGLNRRLAVALLGAHSLGRCRRENSGFTDVWDNTPFELDNGYYRSMVGTQWTLVSAPGNRFTQWSSGGSSPRMMLHADMQLLRNLGIRNSGSPTCQNNANTCPMNRVDSPHVQEFARSETDFHRAFMDAFDIMTNKGLR